MAFACGTAEPPFLTSMIPRRARGCPKGPNLPPHQRRAGHYNLLMSENTVPRRAFLGGATAITALSYSRVMGANERVQLGLIGCGDRGFGDMGNFVKAGNVDVVALCDIYAAHIAPANQTAPTARSFSSPHNLLELK